MPLFSLASWVGLPSLSAQLEVPFGHDANDLPLDTYVFNLEADLLGMLEDHVDEVASSPSHLQSHLQSGSAASGAARPLPAAAADAGAATAACDMAATQCSEGGGQSSV